MSPQLVNFGVDYLRLTLSPNFHNCSHDLFFKHAFAGLSANSDYKEFSMYGFDFTVYLKPGAAVQYLDFYMGMHKVFSIERCVDSGHKRSYKIDFYSTYFYVPDLQPFLFRLMEEIPYKYITVSRIDICCDIETTIESFLEAYRTQYKKTMKMGIDEKTGIPQTWYLGSKHKGNKKHFIRIYDKLLDSQKKTKLAIFWPYFEFDNVTRIEVECRSNSCSNFDVTPYNLISKPTLINPDVAEFDQDLLQSIFASVAMNPSGTDFAILNGIFEQKPQIIKVNKRPPTEILDQLQYARVMKGYVLKLQEMGFDTLEYLTEEIYSA